MKRETAGRSLLTVNAVVVMLGGFMAGSYWVPGW